MSPESITMRVLPPEADTRETISISAAKVKENFGVLRRNERENRFDASMSAVFYTQSPETTTMPEKRKAQLNWKL